MSATRVDEVQVFAVTFTGVSPDDGGAALVAAASTQAQISLEFDSSNMNWACTSTENIVANTVPVRLVGEWCL